MSRHKKNHTRGYVREQRDRWIAKRIEQIRKFWWRQQDYKTGVLEMDPLKNWGGPRGLLEWKDPWDCGHSNCGICRRRAGEFIRREIRLRDTEEYERRWMS